MRLVITRGNDVKLKVTVKEKSGNPFNLNGWSVSCQIRDRPNGQIVLTGSVQILNAEQGQLLVTFTRSQTSQLSSKRKYYIDLLFVDSNNNAFNFPKPPTEVVVLERITQ